MNWRLQCPPQYLPLPLPNCQRVQCPRHPSFLFADCTFAAARRIHLLRAVWRPAAACLAGSRVARRVASWTAMVQSSKTEKAAWRSGSYGRPLFSFQPARARLLFQFRMCNHRTSTIGRRYRSSLLCCLLATMLPRGDLSGRQMMLGMTPLERAPPQPAVWPRLDRAVKRLRAHAIVKAALAVALLARRAQIPIVGAG